jgi:putative MATE family efflux protein
MKDRLFSDKLFLNKLTKLALPIAFQSLMLACVAAADAVMLGSIEQNSMSAVSLATQIQFMQNMVLMAIVAATLSLGSQYWGKNDKKTLDIIFCMSLRVSVLTSVLFFVGCVFFPRILMTVFTNEPALIEIGIKYLRIAGFSYLMTGVSQCYLSMMKVSEHASMSAKISTGAVLLNIVLNGVFIYGFSMGAEGAALATLISRTAEILACVAVSYGKTYIHPSLKGLVTFNKLLIKDYYRIMLPVLGASLLWGVGFTSYSAFMGHLGTDAAAANSVSAVVRDLICCLCDGLAAGGGILVGNELGAGDLQRGKLYGDRVAKLAFIIGGVSSALMFLVTPVVLKTVKLTDKAREYLLQMLLIMAIYIIGRAVNTVIINGIFAAGGDTAFDLYSLVVVMWCLAVPLAALGTFVFHWPIWIVYSCTCLDEVGKIPWVIAHYKKYRWVKDLTRNNTEIKQA